MVSIIDKYYPPSELRDLLLTHSTMVTELCIEIINRLNLEIDKDFVVEAAMLHDIGIFRCNAPSILCNGELPYICHGTEGSKILMAENLPRHALVAERHTGAGLTVEDIIRQNLPIPVRDMTPKSLEEKLICYADKFYSKSGNPTQRKSIQAVMDSMSKFGKKTFDRFRALHKLFS